jgi:uncharacterized RDD family membrane protein YckC
MIEPPARGSELLEEVRSPEQVALHLPIAGPGSRVLAYSVDYVIIVLCELLLLALLLVATPLLDRVLELLAPFFEGASSGNPSPEAMQSGFLVMVALFIIGQLIVETGYFFVSEALTEGRSIGKRLIGLRVVGDDGASLSPQASLVRNVLRVVDVLPGSYLVGLVAMVISNRGQRLGDLAAATIVIRLDRPASALPVAEDRGPAPAFRFSHAQLAVLGVTERMLIRQTLRRIESLEPKDARRALDTTVLALCRRIGAEPVAIGERETFLRALLRAIETQ